MRKIFSTFLAFVILIFSAQVQAADFEIDYGDSKIFTKSELESRINFVDKTLTEWGCTLLRIRYVGDKESNSKENIKYLNELASGKNFKKKFTKCMLLETDFMSPKDPHDGKITAWNYDTEYSHYKWYFGFYKVDGEWKLMAEGY